MVADFDGGRITSEAGAVLLRELENKRGIVRQFAACFVDYRDADRIEHTVEELVKQRIHGLALGYEDLNDHDRLRQDPLVALLVTVSGFTMTLGQRHQMRRRVVQKGRSKEFRGGTGPLPFGTATCCGRAGISSSRSLRPQKKTWTASRIERMNSSMNSRWQRA